MNKTRNK